ncbi:hypothetical protein ABZ345_17605 [Lentzea sp. NPDC005914]|uniref:hypothetical protein n=1 Tax=Lentzea sp. NPDC005914 TaxID=3154572 RepID=UPI003402AE31
MRTRPVEAGQLLRVPVSLALIVFSNAADLFQSALACWRLESQADLGVLQPGTLPFACGMGMYTGTITIV